MVYGGADQKKQVRDLAYGCDVVVATPGRLNDFIDRGIVSMSSVTFLVLDDPPHRAAVDMPPKERRQTLLFSATFALEVQKLAAAFLRPYVWIAVGRVGSTVENIEQRLVLAPADKRVKLKLAAKALAECDGRTLVFVQKKRTAVWLKHCLRRGGPSDAKPNEKFAPVLAEDIHGDRSQQQREAALKKFREGTCRVLVATDGESLVPFYLSSYVVGPRKLVDIISHLASETHLYKTTNFANCSLMRVFDKETLSLSTYRLLFLLPSKK